MSNGLNKCEFIGNLGRDPEMSSTPSGLKVARFSLAINEKRKETETTLWVNVTCFDKLAEVVTQYLTKGQKIFVVGRIQQPKVFTRQDGTNASSLDLIADQVIFLEKKQDAGQSNPNDFGGAGINDNDIPF